MIRKNLFLLIAYYLLWRLETETTKSDLLNDLRRIWPQLHIMTLVACMDLTVYTDVMELTTHV